MTPVTSCKKANGKAAITVNNAASGFDFEYSVDGTYSNTNIFENLAAGNHVATVRDKITKCEFSKNFTIKDSITLKVNISGAGVQTFCIGESPSVTLSATASGGSGHYTYSWPGGTKVVNGTGWYSVTVTDDSTGCTKTSGALVVFIPVICSRDPNDIIGPEGYGPGKMVSKFKEMPYMIRFENDPDFATAPAQVVKITDPLDSNLNILSFRLGDFGFGGFNFTVPPNRTYYTTRLDVMDSLGVVVDVTAGIDIVKKEAFWIFESKDPATGLPPANATLGFLPVNDTVTRKGEGFVTYTIKPAAHTITGDTVHAAASIIFDVNAPIGTPAIFNTIDAVNPVSRVSLLPPVSDTNTITVKWTGSDDPGGSGIRFYDLYASENGTPYLASQQGITDTFTVFMGKYGSTYDFYSIATDNTGNREAAKLDAEQRVTIKSNLIRPSLGADTVLRKCPGTPVNLNSSFNLTGLYTVWNTPTDTAQVVPGIYTLIANNSNGLKDTAFVTVIDYAKPVLGNDTTVGYCSGAGVNIGAIYNTAGYASVQWSTPNPGSAGTGIYTLIVTNIFGCKDTAVIKVITSPQPYLGRDTAIAICSGAATSIRHLYDTTGYAAVIWSTPDPANVPAGNYTLIASNVLGCRDTVQIMVVDASAVTVPAAGNLLIIANRECTDSLGWTHYYYDNGAPLGNTDAMRLLSIKKNGNNIGTVGDGSFKLTVGATAGAGSGYAVKVNSPLVPGGLDFYSMNRYWNIAPTNQPSSSVNIRFYYNKQDVIDVNGSYPPDSLAHPQLSMYKLASGNPDPTTNWANAMAVNYYQNGIAPSLDKWVYTDLGNNQHQAEFLVSNFSGGGAGVIYYNVLPVTGLVLNLRGEEDHIKILWSTLTEINSRHFLVQRSTDGSSFETIATVTASGNSNVLRNYGYDDFTAMGLGKTMIFYRIYQLDIDGRVKYSEIKNIKIPGRKNELVLLYNPVNQEAALKYNSSANVKASIRVTDQLGRTVNIREVSLVKGVNQLQLNTSALAKGIYEVELLSVNDHQSVRMMKE